MYCNVQSPPTATYSEMYPITCCIETPKHPPIEPYKIGNAWPESTNLYRPHQGSLDVAVEGVESRVLVRTTRVSTFKWTVLAVGRGRDSALLLVPEPSFGSTALITAKFWSNGRFTVRFGQSEHAARSTTGCICSPSHPFIGDQLNDDLILKVVESLILRSFLTGAQWYKCTLKIRPQAQQFVKATSHIFTKKMKRFLLWMAVLCVEYPWIGVDIEIESLFEKGFG